MSNIYKALCDAEGENGRTPISAAGLLEMATPTISPLDKALVIRATPTAEDRLAAMLECNSWASEKFRVLRTRLRRLQGVRELKKVLITSAAPAEGKTLVAANLAVSLATHSSQKILLLDGDLRQPELVARFGLQEQKGISHWFASEQPLYEFMYHIEGLPLWLIPGGDACADPLKVLQSERFAEALRQYSLLFDWVIIDTPPLLALADTHVLSTLADGLIVVVRGSKTSTKALVKAVDGLDKATLLGVVFNDARVIEHDDYTDYYYCQSHSTRGNGKKH